MKVELSKLEAEKTALCEHLDRVISISTDALNRAGTAEASAKCRGKVLEKVREACLFDDDDQTVGVTQEPHISDELFREICDAIK